MRRRWDDIYSVLEGLRTPRPACSWVVRSKFPSLLGHLPVSVVKVVMVSWVVSLEGLRDSDDCRANGFRVMQNSQPTNAEGSSRPERGVTVETSLQRCT